MSKHVSATSAAIACAALSAALSAAAEVEPGEELVVNGRLEADQTEVPNFWTPPENARVGETIFFDQAGGPEGIPCVRFANAGDPIKECSFRQTGFTLVPGAKYRLSGKVRTKGFKGRGMLFVINYGWVDEAGVENFPENMPWTAYEQDIVAPKNAQPKNYMIVMCALRFTGELSFADLSLRPLDEAAKKGSAQLNAAKSEKLPRFFPWSPYLNQIDAASRKVVFRFAGELPQGNAFADYTVSLKTADGETSAALQEGENAFTLPGALAEGKFKYEVRRKDADSPLLAGGFSFRTVAAAVPDTSGHRRLNNLVTEVLNAPLADGGTAFSTTRDGWVFIRLEPAGGTRSGASADDMPAVTLDGEKLFEAGSKWREAFRKVRAGRHVIAGGPAAVPADADAQERVPPPRLTGGPATVPADADAQERVPPPCRVIVRQIAEILNYPACVNSAVDTNPSYGWDFYSKHVLPNCTTHNGGHIPKEHWAEFKARGGEFLDNFVSRNMDAGKFEREVAACRALSRENCDGMTLDEHMFCDAELFGDFVGGMRRFTAQYSGDRDIYTWIVNKPLLAGLDREVFALAANATPSGGRILSEIYGRTRANEAEAAKYIDDYLVDVGRKLRELKPGVPFYPDAMSRVGVVLANFSQIPTLSVWHHPEVDLKYFLDMQFNTLANNKVFDGIGLVGVWGSYYSDEEIYRWTFMLARHYCIEGNTDMLSKRHGLKYLPGILENGDFNDGLNGWRVEGDVEVRTLKGFAEGVERRWGGASSGDSFAVLKRGAGAASLSQTLKGLVPGRVYSMDVVCFDAKDVAEKRHRPAAMPLSVTLGDGAEKDASRSWVFVDRRPKEGVRGWGVRCNRHHIVFTAKAEEANLAIALTDEAPEGCEIGVNFVGARGCGQSLSSAQEAREEVRVDACGEWGMPERGRPVRHALPAEGAHRQGNQPIRPRS